jgi:hypothetical protein
MKFKHFSEFGAIECILDIYIKIELMDGNFPKELKNQKVEQMFPSNFADLFHSGDFSDFTVVCSDGIKIPVHRSILYGNSSVLKAMMLTEMQESVENILEVKDINETAMNKILLFMYTQKVDISDDLHDILYGAEKYQIENLKALCIAHMFYNLRASNAVEYFLLAIMYDVERLKKLCLVYIQIHYDTLRSTENWEQLNAEQLELIEKAVKDYKACKLAFEFDMDPERWGHIF